MTSIDHFGKVMQFIGMKMPMCRMEYMKPVAVLGCPDLIDYMYSIIFYYDPSYQRIAYSIDGLSPQLSKQILFTMTVRFAPKSYVINGSIYKPARRAHRNDFSKKIYSRSLGYIPDPPEYDYLTNIASFNNTKIDSDNPVVNRLKGPLRLLRTLMEYEAMVKDSGIYDMGVGDHYNDIADNLIAVYDITFSRFFPVDDVRPEEDYAL